MIFLVLQGLLDDFEMKRVSKKLLCFLLMMLMVVCSLPTLSISAETIENDAETFADDVCENAGRTGDLDLVTDTPDDVFVIENLEDYYAVTNEVGTSKKDIAQTSSQTVVKFVDNSTSKYFPKIGNQGGIGACVVFATVYYQFTYTMNKHRNVATTDDNSFSVKWNYNLINY